MKGMKKLGRWRPWLGLLALGTFAFGLTLEGAPSGKTKRDTERQDLIGARTARPMGLSGQLAHPREDMLWRGVEDDILASDPHQGIDVVRVGRIPQTNLPIAPAVTVNPFEDEPSRMRRAGELGHVPWRPNQTADRGGVAGGGLNACGANPALNGSACSFDIDCDDCNACTQSRCIIDPGGGDGLCDGECQHTSLEGQPSTCSDGVFCNGIERCDGGVCQLGGAGDFPNPSINFRIPCEGVCAAGPRTSQRCQCESDQWTCDGGTEDGNDCSASANNLACVDGGGQCTCATATTNLHCPSGTCLRALCSETNNNCAIPCTQRVCSFESDNPSAPCLVNSDCPNGECETPNDICNDNLDCNGLETCNLDSGLCESGEAPCGPGGFCTESTCSNNRRNSCLDDSDCGGQGIVCNKEVGSFGCYWGRCCTDTGGVFSCQLSRYRDSQAWDPENPEVGRNCNAGNQNWFAPGGGLPRGAVGAPCPEDFKCPKYSGGIIPPVSTADGTLIFPISDAACSGLVELGDDYSISNGSHVAVSQLRFAGGVETAAESRISFEFYDADENFIEDTFFVSGAGLAIRTVEFDPPIIIPPDGFVVARVASAFAPNARILWLSTDQADFGGNDPDKLWVDGSVIETGDWLERCEGGPNDGGWCNPNLSGADCPGGGVCTPIPHVLNFELSGTKVAQPIGACCDKATGTCDGDLPWTCRGEGGRFLGPDSFCATCASGTDNPGLPCRVCSDDPTQSCVRNSECTSGMCIDNDAICSVCVGGADDGLDCNLTACPGGTCNVVGGACAPQIGCTGGACCNPATGDCTEGTIPVADSGTCPDADFQGYGTNCFPNCCEQPVYTGGDNCEDAIVNVINVPTPGPANAITVTISGDNSNASLPDSCTAGNFDPETNLPQNVDLGWWEAFSIDNCAFVRLDFCCTDPIHAPQWVIMWDSCPCEAPGSKQYFNEANPNEPDDPAGNRGLPYCPDDDNLWFKYGPLPAGTYYQPVFSALAGHVGPYQMHITVQGCPEAACCYLECVGGSNDGAGCSDDGDCPGGACNSLCDIRNILDCERARPDGLGGVFLGPPNRAEGVTECGSNCDSGSCCTGPGQCVDDVAGKGGFDPMDKVECDNLGGTFVGGIGCFGGTCNGGDRDGLSCREDAQCPNGGSCTITPEQQEQRSPCPICEFGRDSTRCQLALPSTQFNGFRLSDECAGNCANISTCSDSDVARAVMADDFIADVTGTLDTLCVQGVWGLQGDGLSNCFDTGPPDDWTLYLYEDDGGMPGTVLTVQPLTVIGKGIEFSNIRQIARYSFSLTSPIGLTQGTTYWISVTANSDGQGDTEALCDFFWYVADAGEGNEFSLFDFGDGPNTFSIQDGEEVDMAFCLNISNSTPPPVERGCCSCAPSAVTAAGSDPNCEVTTIRDCRGRLRGEFVIDETDCGAGFTCPNSLAPDNDLCGNAESVTCGTDLIFNNFCATDSAPPLDSVPCPTTQLQFAKDIWYSFTADFTGQATICLCDPLIELDSVLAVYTNNSPSCPTCPVEPSDQVACNDDGCVFTGAGSAVTLNVVEGNCYTIRIGGFAAEFGYGRLRIFCGESGELEAPAVGDDVCWSGGTAGASCSADADCPGGQTCGNKNRFVTVKPTVAAVAGGTPLSIKVTVLENPINPSTVGQSWFAGPQEAAAGLDLAPLECTSTPHSSASWTTGNLHLFGQIIVPGARYEVAMCSADGSTCGPGRVVSTAKWGDVVAPFSRVAGQPNISDVQGVVGRFQGVGSAPNLSRSDLVGSGNPGQPSVPNRLITIADVSAAVDGFRGLAYPHTTVTCSP